MKKPLTKYDYLVILINTQRILLATYDWFEAQARANKVRRKGEQVAIFKTVRE